MITITVRYFGPAADDARSAAETVSLPEPASLSLLEAAIFERHPSLGRRKGHLRYAVNREYAGAEAALADGDEVAVIPPVAGGGGEPKAFLCREPIDAGLLAARVVVPRAGAVCTFTGIIRAEGEPNRLVALEYSAYDAMAVAQLAALRDETLFRFDVTDVIIAHRLGRLRIGEASVVIAVSAPHREEAFAACRHAIDELKRRIPIWKKEMWEGGGASWVEPDRKE